MAEPTLADLLQSRQPQFQEENYVPAEVDYWRRKHEEARKKLNRDLQMAIVNAGLGATSMATAHPMGGPVRNAISNGLGLLGLGLGGRGLYNAYGASQTRQDAQQQIENWGQQGGVAPPMEPLRPQPPISGRDDRPIDRTGRVFNPQKGQYDKILVRPGDPNY